VVAVGTPEAVAQDRRSYTGKFLAEILQADRVAKEENSAPSPPAAHTPPRSDMVGVPRTMDLL
jgi:hypothetical protein